MFATTSIVVKILMNLHMIPKTNRAAHARVAKVAMLTFANIVGQRMNIKNKIKIVK